MSFGAKLPPVGGKPLLTKDRPITLLNEAVRELQDNAIDDASFNVSGLNVTCSVADNKLTVKGSISFDGYSLGEILARLSNLENKLNDLCVDLDLSGGVLKATGSYMGGIGRGVPVADCEEA